MPVGFTLPFKRSSGSLGYFQMTDDVYAATISNLKSLLTTNWGERLMHYNFGCNLREFLFQNSYSDDTRSAIGDRIMSQITTWMPFVNVDELNVILPEDDASLQPNSMVIRMKFSLSQQPDVSQDFSATITQ